MKHPATTAAVVLLALASLVGAATWLLSGSEADDGEGAQLAPLASEARVGFVAASPKERKKAMNIERTKRELDYIREIGEEVGPDLYAVPDANGDPTYYSTELWKGRGRNGEPLFLSVQFKKTRTAPLKDPKGYIAPEAPAFKSKPMKGVLKTGKGGQDSGGEDGSGPQTPDAGDGAAGGGSGAASGSKGG
jgi:hypothetical protein